jgi:hypothetical protein
MIRLSAFLCFLFSLPLMADTQVTHTFEDGEVISAEEFNRNFDDLEAAIDAVGGGEGSPSDGAAYGSPVWVDSSGTLLTGRGGDFGGSILWRVNGTLETIGGVNPSDNTYTPNATRVYSNNNCDPSGFLGIRLTGDSMWVEDGVLKTEGPLIDSTERIHSLLYPESEGGNCSGQPGDPSSNVHEVSDTGVAAPSWTTDGTQMFEDLR